MNQPKISVIVPIYNTEKYLHRCLDSILNQTFTDFEVLLINDGSTDQSPAICDEYACADNRVRVCHKENSGVSSARNMGLELSKGEWIVFIDSDDHIQLDYFEYLYINSKENKLDVLLTSLKTISSANLEQELVIYDKEKACSELIDGNIATSLWAGIFRKECLNGLYLNANIHFFEDFEYMYRVFVLSKNPIGISKKIFYTYEQRIGSANYSCFSTKILSSLLIADNLKKFVSEQRFNHLKMMFLSHAFFYLLKSKSVDMIYISEMQEEFKKTSEIILQHSFSNFKTKILFNAALVSVKSVYFFIGPLYRFYINNRFLK